MKGLSFHKEKLVMCRMSLSDRTQTKSHVLSMQILTCWYSLHLSTKAEVVLEWLFSLPLDEGQSPRRWYFIPQVKKKQVTLNWQEQRTPLLGKSPDKITGLFMIMMNNVKWKE